MSLSPAPEPFFTRCPVCSAEAATPFITYPQLSFVRCSGCGLLYKAASVPGLGAYEADYFQHGQARYLRRWRHRVAKCRNQLLSCLEYLPTAARVLDVGCSAGYVLAAAEALGLAAVGVDVSRFAAATARQRGFPTATARLTHLPLATGSRDIVTMKHVLEHVEDPLGALAEVRRVLGPGGLAFIVVPDARSLRCGVFPRLGRSFHPEGLGWQHHVYFDRHTLGRALDATGFTVLADDKAIFRRRLAAGPLGATREAARFAGMWAWTRSSAVTRLRRELQLIAVAS